MCVAQVFARTVAMTLDEIGRGIGSASAQEFGEQAERYADRLPVTGALNRESARVGG